MVRKKKNHLEVGDDDDVVAYLTLPDHPGRLSAVVKKNIRLRDVIGAYVGPDLFFDFDENNVLVGVEILD
jgi:Protein of unknown function (DUF2283)